jgi:hypothetical protein
MESFFFFSTGFQDNFEGILEKRKGRRGIGVELQLQELRYGGRRKSEGWQNKFFVQARAPPVAVVGEGFTAFRIFPEKVERLSHLLGGLKDRHGSLRCLRCLAVIDIE